MEDLEIGHGFLGIQIRESEATKSKSNLTTSKSNLTTYKSRVEFDGDGSDYSDYRVPDDINSVLNSYRNESIQRRWKEKLFLGIFITFLIMSLLVFMTCFVLNKDYFISLVHKAVHHVANYVSFIKR